MGGAKEEPAAPGNSGRGGGGAGADPGSKASSDASTAGPAPMPFSLLDLHAAMAATAQRVAVPPPMVLHPGRPELALDLYLDLRFPLRKIFRVVSIEHDVLLGLARTRTCVCRVAHQVLLLEQLSGPTPGSW